MIFKALLNEIFRIYVYVSILKTFNLTIKSRKSHDTHKLKLEIIKGSFFFQRTIYSKFFKNQIFLIFQRNLSKKIDYFSWKVLTLLLRNHGGRKSLATWSRASLGPLDLRKAPRGGGSDAGGASRAGAPNAGSATSATTWWNSQARASQSSAACRNSASHRSCRATHCVPSAAKWREPPRRSGRQSSMTGIAIFSSAAFAGKSRTRSK